MRQIKRISTGQRCQTDNNHESILQDYNSIDQKFNELQRDQDRNWIQLVTEDQSRFIRRQGLTMKQSNPKYISITNPNIESQQTQTSENQSKNIKRIVSLSLSPNSFSQNFYQEKIKFFVDRFFTQSNNKKDKEIIQSANSENINYLVKNYGNFLQNSLLDSLIIVIIKQKYKNYLPHYDHFGTAAKILQQFNISPIQLANKQSSSDRQEYLLKKFDDFVRTLLIDWDQKIQQKEKKIAQEDIAIMKQKDKYENDDIFSWIILKTKYNALQKKLKQIIMEVINNYETQLKLIDAIQKESAPKSIRIDQIKTLSNAQLVQKMDPKIYSLFQKIKTKRNINVTKRKLEKPNIVWTEEFERKFLKERKIAKSNNFQFIRSGNFNQLGVMPLFNDLLKINHQSNKRNDLLEKFSNGDFLTLEEIKFIANTSKLLNLCVDKQLINKQIHLLEEDQINQLELQLSEEIISTYDDFIENINGARNIFLKENIIKVKKLILKFDESKAKDKELEFNRKKNKKLKKRFEHICKKMKTQMTIQEEVSKNIFAQIFVKKLNQKVKQIREQKIKNEIKRNEEEMKENERKNYHKNKLKELSKPKQLNFLVKVQQKHTYHPPSKLEYYNLSTKINVQNVNNKNTGKEKNVSMKNQVNEYKLNVYGDSITDRERFISFYSNGPIIVNHQEEYFTEPSKEILSKIVSIQRWIKKYLGKKKYKELKSNVESKINQKKLQTEILELNLLKTIKTISKSQKTIVTNNGLSNSKLRIKTENDEQLRTRMTSGIQVQTTTESVRSFQTRKSKSINFASKLIFSSEKALPKMPGVEKILISEKKQQSGLSIKHQRLLRYSKMDMIAAIQKGGFTYNKEDVNTKDDQGNTALYYAAKNGNLQFIQYLIEIGSDPNQLCSDNTPFHLAFKSGNMDIIIYMLEHGGDLNVINQLNQTPLMFASFEILKQLGLTDGICQNIDPTKFDNNKLMKRSKLPELLEDDLLSL